MFAVDKAFLVNGDVKWVCMAIFPTRKDCRGLVASFNGLGRVRPTLRPADLRRGRSPKSKKRDGASR